MGQATPLNGGPFGPVDSPLSTVSLPRARMLAGRRSFAMVRPPVGEAAGSAPERSSVSSGA
eukprot:14444965-Alexandrium_andersonii.AAC.1